MLGGREELGMSAAAEEESDQKKKKLLVIEDDRMIRRIINNALSDSYEVTGVITGDEAIKTIADSGTADLIIADLDSKSIDGGDFLEKLAARDIYSIPVAFLISEKSAETESRSIARGFRDYYIKKPFSESDLAVRVERILNTESSWRSLRKDVRKKPEITGEERANVEENISRLLDSEEADADSGTDHIGETREEDEIRRANAALEDIQEQVSEKSESFGACKASFSDFCVMYHLMQRQRERKEVTAQIVLFTMFPKDVSAKSSEKIADAMDAFEDVAAECLRRSDVVVKYTSAQLLCMFMDCNQKDGRMVAERILRRWHMQDSDYGAAYEIRTFPL
ncbi:MAG: response regulator [Eubacteriales bacterium]|jgi:DNA-binding response OmpR family regulator